MSTSVGSSPSSAQIMRYVQGRTPSGYKYYRVRDAAGPWKCTTRGDIALDLFLKTFVCALLGMLIAGAIGGSAAHMNTYCATGGLIGAGVNLLWSAVKYGYRKWKEMGLEPLTCERLEAYARLDEERPDPSLEKSGWIASCILSCCLCRRAGAFSRAEQE